MKMKRVLSLASAGTLAVGFLVLSLGSPVLLAHDRYDDRYYDGRHYDSRYVKREAHRLGYEYGFRHGREDRYKRIGYHYKGPEYRHALRGFDPRFGHRRDYERGFRDGYRAGYDAGYYGRGWGYR